MKHPRIYYWSVHWILQRQTVYEDGNTARIVSRNFRYFWSAKPSQNPQTEEFTDYYEITLSGPAVITKFFQEMLITVRNEYDQNDGSDLYYGYECRVPDLGTSYRPEC
jgi:hypothetical protein